MIVSSYIRGAMEEINAIAPGEDVPSSANQLGLRMFNEIVDQWKGMRATIFETVRYVYDLVANQASYTIGDGADWDGFRPEDIIRAGWIDYLSNPTSPVELPVRVYMDEEWADVQLKQLTDSIVFGIWYQKSVPNGTIFVWPISTLANQIALYIPTPIDEVAEDETGLATDIVLPPSGRKALRLVLATAMRAPLERPYDQALENRANRAFDAYVKSFASLAKLKMPAALKATGRRGRFNIITNQGGY